MQEQKLKELTDLKVIYFGSRYLTTQNWLSFSNSKLPEGVSLDDIQSWEEEKQLYLEHQKAFLDGIKTNYEKTIIDRLDAAAALQNKMTELLNEETTSKGAKEIAQTLQTIAKLQDEAMVILKVDAFRSNLYDKNKTSTTNLLNEYKV